MIVVCVTNCPPKLRGDLSKWLLEINTGVYVGTVSARVREALWKRICENIVNGQATMVFHAKNEQHMDFYVHNTTWKPVDFDGIRLMLHPETANTAAPPLEPGFSNAAKRQMGRRRRANTAISSYVLLDIETSGLDAKNDVIIEIGAIAVQDATVSCEKNWLIQTSMPIPPQITELTGIDNTMLRTQGVALQTALAELFGMLASQTVMFYNASFDLQFLEQSAKSCAMPFPKIQVKDVLSMAKSRIRQIANYQLDTVAAHLGIPTRQSHRALDDCRLLMTVANKLNEI
ncbi:MAG: type I-E CRISPR-associated endoribonuclease Cas2e [Oscillospiraceae bacterium]